MNSTVLLNLLVVLLYWGLSLCAGLLAIPPDYATPVWPSAGIALGFVVIYGSRLYPGVFLGALAANLSNPVSQGMPLFPEQLTFAAAVAAGAVAQAAVGRVLMRRLHLLPHELTNGTQILRFLLVVGPVSCLVNSLNGATLLVWFGMVPWGAWFSNWVLWWVGDSVGALVITPFVVRMLKGARTGSRAWQGALMPIIFLGLVVASFLFVRGLEQSNRRAVVADIGLQLEAVLKLNVNELRVVLEAVSSFLSASEAASAKDFETFSAPLLRGNAAIQALQWAPLIPDGKRADFVHRVREQGYPLFEIRELGLQGQMLVSRDRPQYLPLAYIFPMAGNERAHGLDVLALSNRREPRQILQTGEPKASEPVVLVQASGDQRSYILAAPVRHGSSQSIAGLAQVIFNVQPLLAQAVDQDELKSALRLIDVTDPSQPVLLHEGRSAQSPADWQSVFQFLGRALRVELSATPDILSRVSSWQSYAILIGGLLYVALLEAVLLTMLTHQRIIEQQVDIKTQELEQAKNFAERASMSKTEFLASMSHELRTPLNSVIGFTQRVLRRSGNRLDERSRESLVIVERNANHLLGVINNLLDISKVDLGKLDLSISEFPLDEMLMEARDQFMPLAKAKDNRFILDCQFHGTIQADATRVRQIIINLLSNAIKFTSGGEIRLTLREQEQSGVKGVMLQVMDNGIGISPEDMGKLFNKFQKVGKSDKLNPEGTGLGLALVKELVELLKGNVSVSSQPGQGSTFSVWLPLFNGLYSDKGG
ncbi:CHASE domain-containing protein [Ketobacter sp.]|uniref:CHASE domain-containing protein n=1 Tax=Ketobacter sp. TaxID=2083498 RepID=UPI000F12E606|nr:CHASE domain-containing protein [Ketobacter sp.]RLT93226.1 MAG: hypothetical protein D9N14_18815 [Ketobacter sp.]